jgi:hypothetical protein
MAFKWNKMYKWEENHDRAIDEDVEEYISEYYKVEDIADLTREQITEIQLFVENLNEHSVMINGFYRLLSRWDDEQWEAGEE